MWSMSELQFAYGDQYSSCLLLHIYLLFVSLQDMKHRVDLRNLCVCSVDPPGCTDIDDALHCRELENGNLEVWCCCWWGGGVMH